MPRYIDETPWAGPWPWSKRCRARTNSSEEYWGRCELEPHGPEILHTLERGMIWVRWRDGEEVGWTEPDYRVVADNE